MIPPFPVTHEERVAVARNGLSDATAALAAGELNRAFMSAGKAFFILAFLADAALARNMLREMGRLMVKVADYAESGERE